MRKMLFAILVLALVSFGNKEQQLTSSTTYQLIWSDEFNVNGAPDSTKWEYETGFVRNEEAQWYQKENAICDAGVLVITGKKEHKLNPTFIPTSTNWKTKRQFIAYTSASVIMKKVHAFQYGKMEVSARIEAQTGLWPTIWTLGVSGKWPSNGEVDVMEYYGDKILANFAYGSKIGNIPIWNTATIPITTLGASTWANKFHVWTFEWNQAHMIILLDGVIMNSIDLNTTINKSDGKNPFRQPHYLLLNLALGGNNGGSLANTIFPSKYEVDYVRIYQQQ